MPSKTLRFNTGRLYTANGQRIVATLHDDGVVTFHDHDRMITGEIDGCGFAQTEIMRAYDSGQYLASGRAWSDGMMAGGCNAKWEA